eukprot:9704853-Karenia_brevis.AAC.1
MDCKAHHAGVCTAGGDKTRAHHGARNQAGRFASSAGHCPELEKPGLLQPSPEQPGATGRRPADVYLPSWRDGTPAALDFAITSPHRQDMVGRAAESSGVAARSYESFKRTYLDTERDCASQGISFIPMVGEPTGGWG